MTQNERARRILHPREDLLAEPYHYLASGLDNIFLLNGVTEENADYGPIWCTLRTSMGCITLLGSTLWKRLD